MATTIEQHLARAVQAQQQGRRSDVIREAEAALRLNPDHPAAHNLLGVDALAQSDFAAAQRHFEAATRADPKATALWLNLAKAHRLAADDFLVREHFPWLADLEAQTDVIRAELVAILESADAGLSPYVTMPPGTPRNVWTELNNSVAWSALHLWKEGERIEGACARAPNTAKIVEGLPLAHIRGKAPTVFFSILQAGKHIPPHTGVTNTRTIIHLPLIVPRGCSFRVGGETREWREGEAFAFDDTIEHEAWNKSDQDRALLILDCWNPHLSEHEQAMICRLFAVADAQKNGRRD